ncbi:MAG: hypothetical protein IIA59_08990 [Candidatus Marinimicrobia bacterium]|nr:hypothetical protein [Candidatus Neomarinimicrobiota bacterium]
MIKSLRDSRALLIMILLLAGGQATAQVPPPTVLVTIPTAGTLARGEYEIELLMQRGGGILGRLAVGFSDRFTIGMSYGVSNFIGDDMLGLNRLMPEAQLKYRLYDETVTIPAITIGLDSQGRGDFWEQKISKDTTGEITIDMARYDVKAIGAYVVLSKNWDVLGNFGSHVGISKNLTEQDEDDDFNFFFGFDKELSPSVIVFVEFNAALDDNKIDDADIQLHNLTVGQGAGYLNAGLRLTMAPGLYMEFDFNDILVNKSTVSRFSRELKVNFLTYF